jgi:predicted nuclease of predicted toxin-antitoxin system
MRVLLDECVPRKLRDEMPGHEVKTVAEMKWSGTKNGALLQLAAKKFDVLVTVDQGIPYQQNLAGIPMALVIIVAPNNDIKDLRPRMPDVLRMLATIQAGQVIRVSS